MANLSHYGSDALAETEITSYNNIVPYSQYVIESQQTAIQSSNSFAQQDALISSVIEQLKTQVINYTKINLDNKSVNDTLTVELERYKEQVKVLKEGQNVNLRSSDNISDSSAQSVEIDRLKQTLSQHLKEKESLMKTVTLLKNDFKKEESRNIDREIALEKKIKQLDNIVFKRDQYAQTIHMLTKPQLFYDHTTKQALGFQNPFYLKKAQQLEPKLYDGNVIKNTSAIVIPDSEETLMLAEESRSKMLLKQKDHMMLEKKVNTTPVDYVNSVNFPDPTLSSRPTKVEVPKELPKVSMVNRSLKKLKHCLAGFDVVVKERTMCLKLKTGLLNKKDFIAKEIYDKLFKSFSTLEKHCISLEVDTQLNKEIFQRDNSVSNQSAPSFDQLFELNEMKAQSQEKDTVIKKLKERIKSLSGKIDEDKIKKDLEEIETINIELDHRVSKLIAENEHLKQTYKQLSDSIKPARIRSKEQCDDLINQVNLKSMEISNLYASLQEKVLVITPLKDDLRKLKRKALVDNVVTKHTIDPEMLKINEEATVLRDLVEQIKSKYPLDHSLESACRYAKLIQELLTNISKTCPSINNTDEKLVVVTPKNKDKRVKPSTSASGSHPSGNTKKDKIRQTPSSTQKNKHSRLNANSELKCTKCNGCMLSANHDLCVLDFINNVNAHNKSKSVKKNSKNKVWKPTGKVFTKIGYIWRPTGRTFTIVGNTCPLTRITTTTEVPLRKPTALENETPKPVVTLVYSRKPRKSKTNFSDSKSKVPKSVSANKKEPSQSRGSKVSNVPSSSLNECRVYYVEGLGHNLFSVGQFCDSNLEVAFRQHTCFIRNLEGVDLLTGSRGNNLYTLSLGDMMSFSPICLLSKASKTISWLWPRRLSHMNFDVIIHLARHGLVRGLPKLKFEKEHLCSAYAMCKSKKKPHKPKSEDTNQEKLSFAHGSLWTNACHEC
ncbi:retrovirus-related pol polyprotein from transposon TNT 1-94 [Tanacetum coccineum]|uniref:Retrovirus-related pol polyprotein from transposon TNT 1-94 n=1 Tax=Tanacetum coccineum TaxID=301880 RepID=A0ABQ5IK69_9ASTR